MKVYKYLRRFLAVGQKTLETENFGQGFNYWLEVRVPVEIADTECERALKQVLTTVDHRALGVDVNLAVTPDAVGLTNFVAAFLRGKLGPDVGVRLERGDGLIVTAI